MQYHSKNQYDLIFRMRGSPVQKHNNDKTYTVSQQRYETASKNKQNHVSPAVRHKPHLDYAIDAAILYFHVPEEETGFIDALDLATWLSKSPEKKTTKAGILWGAIRWFASEYSSARGLDRDIKAIELLDDIKRDLPAKQISYTTLLAYEATLKAMLNWSKKKRATDIESTTYLDTLVVTQDMLARTDLSPTAKKYYRSALLWYLDQKIEKTERNIQARSILCEKDALPEIKKRKQGTIISEKEINVILSHLEVKAQTERNEISAITIIWIKAGLATGLRPIEWLDANWATKEKLALQTISAKTKIGKVAYMQEPHDGLSKQVMQPMELRQIPLFADDDKEVVNKMLNIITARVPLHLQRAERQAVFNKLYLSVKQRLQTVCKQIYKGKKNYSLYTFRRQFSANAKAAVGSDATAELMGHVNAQSPSTGYYGKANQAHRRFKAVGEQRRMQEAADASSDKSAQRMPRERG